MIKFFVIAACACKYLHINTLASAKRSSVRFGLLNLRPNVFCVSCASIELTLNEIPDRFLLSFHERVTASIRKKRSVKPLKDVFGTDRQNKAYSNYQPLVRDRCHNSRDRKNIGTNRAGVTATSFHLDFLAILNGMLMDAEGGGVVEKVPKLRNV